MENYISISHWGLFPISAEQAASYVKDGSHCMVDGYLVIPFEKEPKHGSR